MPYLAQLLAGYGRGLDHDPPESGEAILVALAEENDAYRRGLLLGLLANWLVQSERSSSKISEIAEPQRAVTEAIQILAALPSSAHVEAIAEPAHVL
jgi:hypothetical protein